ncbi:hypothetical protein ACOME3_004386 [Neoechinorhynchus agilis]
MSIRLSHPDTDGFLMDIAFDGLQGSSLQQLFLYAKNAGFNYSECEEDRIYFLRLLHSMSSIKFFANYEITDNVFVSDGDTRGYCPSYDNRRYLEGFEEFLAVTDRSVVTVCMSDQKAREDCLTSRWISGSCSIKDQAYGVLEYISRSREAGVLVAGREEGVGLESLRAVTNLDSKSLFYVLEQLETSHIVNKQDCVFKHRCQSRIVVHSRYRPRYEDYIRVPEDGFRPIDFRQARGVTLEADLIGTILASLEQLQEKELSLAACKTLLGISKRVLRRLLSKCVSRGDIQRVVVSRTVHQSIKRCYMIKLLSSGLIAFERDMEFREQKRSHLSNGHSRYFFLDFCGDSLELHTEIDRCQAMTECVPVYKLGFPISTVLYSILEEAGTSGLTPSQISSKLRLDFYKLRRICFSLSKWKEIKSVIVPKEARRVNLDEANEDNICYVLKSCFDSSRNSIKKNSDPVCENATERAMRRKNMIKEYVKKEKCVLLHKMNTFICGAEKKLGVPTMVDRKTIARLIAELEHEGEVWTTTVDRIKNSQQHLHTILCDESVQSEEDDVFENFVRNFIPPLSQTFSDTDDSGEVNRNDEDSDFENDIQKQSRCSSMYGYSAKYQRCMILHQLLFYLIHCFGDSDEDWAKHIKRPYIRSRNQISIGDLTMCMPVSIFTSLVRVSGFNQELL